MWNRRYRCHHGNTMTATGQPHDTTFLTDSLAADGAVGADVSADAIIWGVCASTARRLGLSVAVVRAVVVVLGVAGGFGIVLYLGLALWTRTAEPPPLEVTETRNLGAAVAASGAVWELCSWWPGARVELVLPVALVAMGVVLGWRASDATEETIRSERTLLRPVLLRIVGGSVMCLAGFAVVLGQRVSLGELRDTGIAIVVVLAGLAVVMGPTALRFARSLGAERDARIRSHERAAVAAHLHDSVLQTLTLIQKRSDDPAATVALARHQERSLRRWLYGGGEFAASMDGVGWRGRAEQLVAEIEDQYLVAIELVMVGDGESTPRIDAALLAAREALVNAAKFSGVDTVDVFCERADGRFDVYVHDRGKGFDRETIAADRHGIRDSIIGRVERAGGTVSIRTALGEGTEVHLEVPE